MAGIRKTATKRKPATATRGRTMKAASKTPTKRAARATTRKK